MIYYNEKYYSDLSELLEDFEEEDLQNLPIGFTIVVHECKPQKIWKFDVNELARDITESCMPEDCWPEDPDREIEKVMHAFKQCVDIEKLNEMMPTLWYPIHDKFITFTKEDIEAEL